MTPNGPAIKGGCVTRRSTGQVMVMFGRKTITVRGGYGACFCRPVTSCLGYSCIAVQGGLGQVSFHGAVSFKESTSGAP